MPPHKDLQEILGGIRAQLLHAKVFEHQQVDAGELLDEIAPGAGGREVEGAAHERAMAGADRADRNGRRDVRLADPGRADEERVFALADEARGGRGSRRGSSSC